MPNGSTRWRSRPVFYQAVLLCFCPEQASEIGIVQALCQLSFDKLSSRYFAALQFGKAGQRGRGGAVQVLRYRPGVVVRHMVQGVAVRQLGRIVFVDMERDVVVVHGVLSLKLRGGSL